MTSNAYNLPHRYPGLKPFERRHSAIFYGRGADVQKLTNLILRERLVVLFAKSGVGKTSLLQAGVAPILEQKGYLPIFLRTNNTGQPIVESIGQILHSESSLSHINETDQTEQEGQTLWEMMKRMEFDLDGLPVTPVLVLDQFEEVFTLQHSEASFHQFLEQLGDLINESMPESVRTSLLSRVQQGENAISPQAMEWWEKDPDLRVVISIRSDFLHLLDEISPQIPNILRNRYQLMALDRTNARQAIEAPAAAQGAFASPPFQYAEPAIEEILDFLSGRLKGPNEAGNSSRIREEIESFNLQILCQQIEGKIIETNQAAGFEVASEFFGGQKGMEDVIRNFYERQLLSLPAAYTRRTGKLVDDAQDLILTARKLIEESLVTPIGRRCSMVDDFLFATWNVSADFLDTLVDSRLLRKEMRLDDFYYEITHDTLLPAIIESRDLRRSKEQADQERQQLQEELREEARKRRAIEQELNAVREKRKLARQVSILSIVLLGLSLVFGLWFLRNYIGTVRAELRMAERNFRNELFDAAIPSYENLSVNYLKRTVLEKVTNANIDQELTDARRFRRIHVHTLRLFEQGDSLFFAKDYAAALDYYRESNDSLNKYISHNFPLRTTKGDTLWRISPQKIDDKKDALELRLNSTINTLIDQFKIRQRDAEVFMEAGVWGQALRNIKAMESLLPNHPEDILKLQRELNLVDQSPEAYVRQEKQQCIQRLGYNRSE